jgi:hypothetical protein
MSSRMPSICFGVSADSFFGAVGIRWTSRTGLLVIAPSRTA